MTRAHLYRPLQDAAGNLQRGATVRLLRPGTNEEVAANLYVADEGSQTYSQPIACPTGFLNVYFDAPRRVRVAVTPFGGGTETFFDDIDTDIPSQTAQQTPITPIEGMNSLEVQAALVELQATKYGPGNDVGLPTASEVAFTPYGVYLDEVTDVQNALQGVDDTLVALDGRLDTNEGLGDTQTGRLDDHDDRFDGLETDVAAHDGRLDQAEADLLSHDGRLDTAEGLLVAYDGRLDTAEADLVAHDGRLDALEGGTTTADLAAHLADTTDAHDASAISVVPVGTIAATDVQAALAELDTEKATTGHTHTASPSSLSTIAAGLPGFSGRKNGDLHFDLSAGRLHIHTGTAGAGYVTEAFDGSGVLNGKVTDTGSKTWVADTNVSRSGDGSVDAGGWGSGGYARKGYVNLGAVPQEQTVIYLPDPAYSYFTTYFGATAFSLGGGGVDNGVNLNIGPISGAGTQTVNWSAYNLTTSTALGTGTVSINTGLPLKVQITRTGGGVVTMKINDVTVYTGTPAGVTWGNLAGFAFSGLSSTPRVLDFTAGDAGTLAWTFSDPQYFQGIVPGAITVADHVFKPGIRIPAATTARQFVVRFDAALSGGATTVVARRFNNGTDTGEGFTVTVPDGQTVGSTTGAVATAAGDVWKFNVTAAAGSPTDMLVSLDAWG